MSWKEAAGEVIPLSGFLNTLLQNLLVARQVILAFLIPGVVGWFLKDSLIQPYAFAAELISYISLSVELGIAIWIVEHSISRQSRKKAVLFLFNSADDA